MNKRLISITVFLIIIATSLFWVDGSKYLYGNLAQSPIFVSRARADSGGLPEAVTTMNHCGTISSNQTWYASDNVHVITCDVTVSTGYTLTIEAGAIVKFNLNYSIINNGTLRILGDAGNEVYLTSIRDDTIGGDTNGDAGATTPARGNWRRIQFGSSSDDINSLIDHAIIRYGGGTNADTSPDTLYGAITLFSAAPTLQNTTFRDNLNYAIRADLDSDPVLINNTYINNNINGLAITSDGYGTTLNRDATWNITGTTYYIEDSFAIGTDRTLTIMPGVIVKFNLTLSLSVNGNNSALRILGTSENPVNITSIRDDTVGGDTNNDSSSSTPARGNWRQIMFSDISSDARSLIDHAIIRYGGGTNADTSPDTLYGAITMFSAAPTIQNSTIRDGLNYAYRADLCSFPILINNTLINNGINGIAITSDVYGTTLNIDATWGIVGTTYYIRDSFAIGTDRTLTISPGVVVKFNLNLSLSVNGNNSALRILGTSENPVNITSIRDDTVGGDTNNDSSSSTPARGNWRQIMFADISSDARSLIDHAIIRYGAGTNVDTSPDTYYGAITMFSAATTIENTTLRDNLNYPVRADLGSDPVLINNTYINNNINGLAITSDGYGTTLNRNATWSTTGTTYFIRDTIYIGAERTLTVLPGVIVKFNNSQSMIVNGLNSTLNVLGEGGNPVYFTTINDDTIGGDTNNNSTGTSPAKGNWDRIEFGDLSLDTSRIENAIIRYGGDTGNYWGAINLVSASPMLTCNNISLNAYAGIKTNSSTPTLDRNNIYTNDYGIRNATTAVNVMAEYQWWGSITGPYHSTNLGGTGNPVTDGVDFTPWATEPWSCEGEPQLTFSSATYSVSEAGGNATITVNLSASSSSVVTVNYATSNGTATAGSDYTATSGTLTFNPGQTSKTFSVPIINDAVDEPNETVNLALSNPVNATLGTPNTAVLTITDDDPTPSCAFSSATYSVGEADGSTTITVNLSNPSSYVVTCNYTTSNGTATAPGDYTSTSGTLTFNPGQTSKTFNVTIVNDTSDEADETVNLALSSPVNATLGTPSTAVLTIIDDDQAVPTVYFNSATYSVSESGGTATITVNLSPSSTSTITVNYATSNGTATAGQDYTATSGTLTFNPGQTSKTFSVPITSDTIDEPDETVNLALSAPVNAALGTPNTAVLTIVDDDPMPSVYFSSATYSVDEADGTATITVNLSNPKSVDVQVNYATSNGTATAPGDYTSASGTLIFNPGQTSKTFTVTIINDTLDEPDETVNLTLSAPVNVTLGTPSAAVLTIVDDDQAVPTVYLSSTTYSVGEADGAVTITVNLSNASSTNVRVDYTTSNNTATAGADYEATSETLTFNAGQTSKTFTVDIINDTADEADETFNITLSNPVNATLGSPSAAVVTIIDDDVVMPEVYFNSATYSVGEAVGTATITVNLSFSSSSIISVNYATSNGTATAGSDYTATAGTLNFNPGETSKTFSVQILNDTMDEPDETINLALSAPVNATLGSPNTAVLTISDDDPLPACAFSSATYSVSEAAGSVTITVNLSNPSSSTVSCTYTASNGTATGGSDYTPTSGTLTFNPGQTSKTFSISILDDTMDEPDETINLTLSIPVNATLGTPNTAILTIIDDDPTPTCSFSSATYSVSESGGIATITVVLSNPSYWTVSCNYATSNGTATAGSDYTATSGTIIFSSGEISKTFSVTIINDTLDEYDETVNLALSNPVNATLGTPNTAVLTIQDDDQAVPSVYFSSANYDVVEGGVVSITVLLSNPSDSTVSVNYATSDGTATAGADYEATSGILTFNPGQTSKTLSFGTNDDNIDEPNETFYITFSNPVGATLGTPYIATVTIIDNDPTPDVRFSSPTYSVGESDGSATITIELSNPSSNTITVQFITADGTATAGSDYTAVSGTVTFNPGQTSKSVPVTILSDNLDELDETVNLTLSSPVNAVLGTPSTSVLTIVDDDPMPACAFSFATYSVGESGGTATITVNLSNPSSLTVTCNYATSNGTATAGADYEATSGTLTFSPGQTSKTFTVVITNDTTDESNETVNLTLSSPVNATLGIPSTAVLTIVDDDGPSLYRIMLPIILR